MDLQPTGMDPHYNLASLVRGASLEVAFRVVMAGPGKADRQLLKGSRFWS